MCGCLLRAPYWGPGLKPRHVPWLGIELVSDPLVRRLAVNPLSHTSQGQFFFFFNQMFAPCIFSLKVQTTTPLFP